VTGDGGAFELPNLPPGTYLLEAWHETFGSQTLDITLDEKETKDITFTFRSSQ
jgi:phage FluMu gp28-like protein